MTTSSGEKVFTSWKEIAAFFGKGVRTVQRWEQKFGLPISRPVAAKNVVLATEADLREWIRTASSHIRNETDPATKLSADNESTLVILSLRLKRLENNIERLSRVVDSFSERIAKLGMPIPIDSKARQRSKNLTARPVSAGRSKRTTPETGSY